MEKIEAVVAEIVKAINGAGVEKEKYEHAFLKVLDGFSEIMALTCQVSPKYQYERNNQINILELLQVKESYKIQVERYRSLGWLVEKDGVEGIIGFDKNFYPIPLLQDIEEKIVEQKDLLHYKYWQGFRKFLLVPFGMSYVEMYNKLATEQKRFAEDPVLGLYRTDSVRTKFTKTIKAPLFTGEMNNEAELGYYPETLYSDDPKIHQAKSKMDLIMRGCFLGWEIHLVPENPLLAMKGKGRTMGDRPIFEANKHFGDYLERMKGREGTKDKKVQPVQDAEGQNVYRGEVGMIPEVWVAWALEELYDNNQVLHDWFCAQDAAAIMMGALTKKKSVAFSTFSHYHAQVGLHDFNFNSDMVYEHFVVASSVKVC